MGGRVFRGSPYKRGAATSALHDRSVPRTTMLTTAIPELHVTISNSDPGEAADSECVQRVVELPPGDHGVAGGKDNFTKQQKPSATSVPKQRLAPPVARLFSAVYENSRTTRDDIAELMNAYPQGIELSNFCRVFETCFHRPFDSRWSDATSLRQMLERMVDLIECVELGNEVIVRRKDGPDYFQGNALHVSAIILQLLLIHKMSYIS